jgi:hypothetical protein
MQTDISLDPGVAGRRCPDAPRFRLRFGAIFWRVAILVLVLGEYKVWRFVRASIPRDAPVRRVMGVIYFTPRALFIAFAVAAAVTVAIDLLFRLFIRPAMVQWYYPRCRDRHYTVPIAFHLAARESVLAELPARRMIGRRRVAGTLVRTSHRVCFYPFAWDGEAWETPLERVRDATLQPTIRRVLGFVRGYPDHVVIRDDRDADVALIVAEPDVVRSWFA